MHDDEHGRTDYITFREAVNMFVSKADFDKFSIRIENKLDELLAGRLPKWVWVGLGGVAAFLAPLVAALLTHYISKAFP